jgi:hypothetical protein
MKKENPSSKDAKFIVPRVGLHTPSSFKYKTRQTPPLKYKPALTMGCKSQGKETLCIHNGLAHETENPSWLCSSLQTLEFKQLLSTVEQAQIKALIFGHLQ